MQYNKIKRAILSASVASSVLLIGNLAQAEIAATHVYHNHMPNFWPYYDVSQYDSTAVGGAIRYAYDGQVIDIKNSPPANYTFFLPNGSPMPHDDLVTYYSHHAKTGAYLTWPMDTVKSNAGHALSQTHVTMSASVVNNVQSFAELGNLSGYNLGWGEYWRDVQGSYHTTNGFKKLDLIHFTGHHSMGPLVGNNYFLKDLIYHNVTLSQNYFLGGQFKSSKGFFPTELGFSERLIPVLNKLGIEWSVLGNVHYSRTLRDYPYLNDPGKDCLISPPNRADMQNSSDVGDWVELKMTNEQQVTYNKFPFAAIPHWVRYIDPETNTEYKVAGIPVEQAGSWEEGYLGSAKADPLKPYVGDASSLGRTQYFVLAHDGDNSSGRAGSGDTWMASGNVTYSDDGVTGMGVDEYLKAHPIPADDIVHVQDGSWIDTRDSSSDPTWYHWHMPMGVWAGQLAGFNEANGTDYPVMFAKNGKKRNHMPSMEYGYNYLERNFALLQAAENYAKTAEQIWLDDHPNYWSPSSAMDHEITYEGNQLNPYMMAFPVKGDAASDYKGGANPAELAWYFLVASIDSGFGYYDENTDDHVKPTISFNQSLHFSEPYVEANKAKDKTGPSLWWPQRYPYNPGSANASKAEGWATMYMNNVFSIYTFAYDVSGIESIKVKVRTHTDKWADAKDKTFKLYEPEKFATDPDVDPTKVSAWQTFDLTRRDLTPDINGVAWQPGATEVFEIVPAKKIGDMYYAYFDQYREQLLDYYIEAVDSKGNVTKSEIQQVYVGAGRFSNQDGTMVEDINGSIEGEHPFFSDQAIRHSISLFIQSTTPVLVQTRLDENSSWSTSGTYTPENGYAQFDLSYEDGFDGLFVRFSLDGQNYVEASQLLSKGTSTIKTDGSVVDGLPADMKFTATVYYCTDWASPNIHYRISDGAWTTVPGEPMKALSCQDGCFYTDIDLGNQKDYTAVFNNVTTWDNNNGADYKLTYGETTIESGKASKGSPCTVANESPVAVINASAVTAEIGDTISLNATDSTDADGSIASYQWSTGETTETIQVSFDTAGTHLVNLTVTDDLGATNTTSISIKVNPAVVTTAAQHDFDGDGTADIFWRNATTGENYLHFMQAGAVKTVSKLSSIPSQWTLAAQDDFNGDGKTDLLWRNTSTGENIVYLMDGATKSSQTALNIIADQNWTVATTGDFDADGKADILWRNNQTGQNHIYLMNGAAIKASKALNIVATDWQVAGSGDLNADGKTDIIWRNSATGLNYIYLMNGASIATATALNTVPSDWTIAAVSDFNGDSKADLLWRNIQSGVNYVYLMNGNSITESSYINTVPTGWSIADAYDINADGKSDIIWRHAQTGVNYAYQMNGAAIQKSSQISTVGTQWNNKF